MACQVVQGNHRSACTSARTGDGASQAANIPRRPRGIALALPGRRPMRRLVSLAVLLLASRHGVAWGLSDCPGGATLTVFVDNLSDAPSVDITLDGVLAADAVTCTGGGVASYEGTMTCTGQGVV